MSSPFELKLQNSLVPADTTLYPPVTAVRTNYMGVSSVEVYPYYALLVKNDGATGSATPTVQSNSTAWGGLSVQTAANGTDYTVLPSYDATTVDLVNNTGTDLFVKSNTVTIPFRLANASSVQIIVAANSNEISVKRADNSTSQVTLFGMFHKY